MRATFPVTVGFCFTLLLAPLAEAAGADEAQPPKVGDKAPDFKLKSLAGKEIQLSKLAKKTPVVLVVLRGYPGYQCPICRRQVSNLMGREADLAEAGAQVVLVYPGPAEALQKRAKEFVRGKTLPNHFELVIDPDYKFTNAYGLRWDAPRETAYPSTFVIGTDGKVRFAEVSKSHGGRVNAKTVLAALEQLDD